MSTSIRMPRDDEEHLLPDYDDADEASASPPPMTRGNKRQDRTKMWPRDMIGMNLEAKEGTVASERISIRLGTALLRFIFGDLPKSQFGRVSFLRKVFGILTFQIVLTTAICTAIYATPGVKEFVQHQSWFLLLTLFASIGLIIGMHVHARNVPTNYVLLASFTVVQALTLGTIVSLFEVAVILEAALLTSVIVFSLFVYTLQSKRDFVKYYALAFSLLGVLLMAGFMQIFLQSPAFNFFVNVAGAALFCLFLVIDIDLIMNYMNAEDYILACITLYMDIINLFIRILQLLGEAQRS